MEEILIVGTVRDVAKTLKRDIYKFRDILGPHFIVRFYVVESDSTDATREILDSLSKGDPNFRYTALGNLENALNDRIERIRFARNKYVDEIRNNSIYDKCKYVIVADLDGVNSRISYSGFLNAFNTQVNWDVLTANQLGKYYDLLSLRHPIWSPNNCFTSCEWLSPIIGMRKAWKFSVFDRMIRIPQSANPIEAESAFGGLSLNKRWVFEKCDYSRDEFSLWDDNEHVSLCSKIRKLNGKIYIQPDFINARWTTHSIHGIRLVHFSKLISDFSLFKIFKPILRPFTKMLVK